MKSLRLRRVVAALSVSAVAGFGLVACGSDDSGNDNDSSESGDADADADADADGDAGSAPFDVAEGEGINPSEFADFYAEAATIEESAAVEMVTTAAGQTITYTGVTTFDPDDIRASYSGDQGEMIIVDNVLYTQLDPSSDQFVSIELDDPSNPFGQAFSASSRPEKAAQALGNSAQSVTYTGVTEVNGADAYTYDVVVETAAFYQALGLTDFADLVDQGYVPTELEQTVSFDEEGRVVRTEQFVEGTDQTPESSTEITYTEFGVEVDVEAPADSIPLTEALSAA